MLRDMKDPETGKKIKIDCCPSCMTPFKTIRYCALCDRQFAHADEEKIEKERWIKPT